MKVEKQRERVLIALTSNEVQTLSLIGTEFREAFEEGTAYRNEKAFLTRLENALARARAEFAEKDK
jgi:hypothetical protein